MPRFELIGIGVGDPDFVTVQAIDALNRVDVFFVLDKGPAADDLARARQRICERFISEPHYRTVIVADPPRDRAAADYSAAVQTWRDERALALEAAILDELADDACGGLLVWGDPSLYDSSITVLNAIVARGKVALDYSVIPGISSIHALTARHKITLNRVAGAVQITTGRRLAAELPANADDIVVMLDADLACRAYVGEDLDIYWGAYLGDADEILISGRLSDVIDQIVVERRAARERKGWIMDSYLLRRTGLLR